MSDEGFEPDIDDASELLGAADIVAAFTALRHEIKLQVRAARDLTGDLDGLLDRCLERHLAGVAGRFDHLESALRTSARQPAVAGSEQARKLAEALTEIEETLERAIGAFGTQIADIDALAMGFVGEAVGHDGAPANHEFEEEWRGSVRKAPWVVRMLAPRFVRRLEHLFEQARTRAGRAEEVARAAVLALADAGQGLELLLVRTRRLMDQAGIRRLDVLHEPFDADRMRAIDIVEDTAVPDGHVAEQLRPGYLLNGTVLRAAEVRVAR